MNDPLLIRDLAYGAVIVALVLIAVGWWKNRRREL